MSGLSLGAFGYCPGEEHNAGFGGPLIPKDDLRAVADVDESRRGLADEAEERADAVAEGMEREQRGGDVAEE